MVDVRLGTLLGVVAALGTVAGARRVPAEGLRKRVAWACLAAGTLIIPPDARLGSAT